MPTYEYVCASCGNHFDTVQSFSDAPLERCEICGGQLRRVFHPAGILFKGSGFYSTDYGRRGRKKESEGEKATTSKDGDSGSAKSDEGAKKVEKKPAET